MRHLYRDWLFTILQYAFDTLLSGVFSKAPPMRSIALLFAPALWRSAAGSESIAEKRASARAGRITRFWTLVVLVCVTATALLPW
jgi:hypothetical protein